jgi:hypothetical protein
MARTTPVELVDRLTIDGFGLVSPMPSEDVR